jgi:hypothetical protein
MLYDDVVLTMMMLFMMMMHDDVVLTMMMLFMMMMHDHDDQNS